MDLTSLLLQAFVLPGLLFAAIGLLSSLVMRNLDVLREAVEVLIERGLVIWVPLGLLAVLIGLGLPGDYQMWTTSMAVAYGILYWLCLLLVPVIFLVAVHDLARRRFNSLEWKMENGGKEGRPLPSWKK